MSEYKIKTATKEHMGQINLVNIQADLGTFGIEYPSFTFSFDDLNNAIDKENVLVALYQNQVVAFIKFFEDLDNGYGYLHQISVSPDHQRKGLAIELIQKMFCGFKESNVHSIGLTTSSETPWGQSLYNKLGFKERPADSSPPDWHQHIKEEMGHSSKDKIYMEFREDAIT